MKKIVACMVMCFAFAFSETVYGATIVAGGGNINQESGPGASRWEKDDAGWWFRNYDGTYPKNCWLFISGRWYYFLEDGYMKTGFLNWNGNIYYLDDVNGYMVMNEKRIVNGIQYSFNDEGIGTAEWAYKTPLAIPPDSEKTEFHLSVDVMADRVLASITSGNMGQREKAVAIYHWVKRNLKYSGYSPVGDWVSAADDGLRRRRGDCYTYYATSAELLNRAGMQTIEVIRSTDNNHYWNLVNVDGKWYHFDPCPRSTGGDFCLLTDVQIARSRAHIFDHNLYPPTP